MCVGVVPQQPPTTLTPSAIMPATASAYSGGLDIKDGVAVVVHAGQSSVGLHHDGLVRNGEHASGEPSELGRSRALQLIAQNVGADGIERDGGNLGTRAQEGATVFLKGHGGKDGQVGVLAAGEDGRLDLGQVGHSLDNKEVHTRGDAGAHFLGKEVDRPRRS